MNICIFPGTFNPIHKAHLEMAHFALKKYNFDKIIFIPSYLPPHKEIDSNLAKHRFNMVKLAVSNNSKFEVSDIEFKSETKSYSLITVKKIIREYKIKDKLNFLIGTDAFVKLNSWYKAEELKKLVHFIVFQREGDGDSETYISFRNDGWDFEVVNNKLMDISSTKIRNSGFKKNITNEVEEYIVTNGLYKN